jgi:hypothetical protein
MYLNGSCGLSITESWLLRPVVFVEGAPVHKRQPVATEELRYEDSGSAMVPQTDRGIPNLGFRALQAGTFGESDHGVALSTIGPRFGFRSNEGIPSTMRTRRPRSGGL